MIDTEIKEGKLEAKDRFTLFEEKLSQLNNEVTQLKKENLKRVNELTQLKEENVKRVNEITQLTKENVKRVNEITQLKKEIEDLKISLNIMAQINEQRDIHYKSKIDHINKNMQLVLNSYKMLYMRKLANLILEQIYLKYSKDLGKGKIPVGNNNHNIIALFQTSQKKYKRDYYQINLIIDFLRFIWDKCSNVIHLKEINFPLQVEIFHEYLKASGIPSKNINAKEGIEINKLIGLIFNDKVSKKSKRSPSQIKDSQLVNAIHNLLKKKKEPNTTSENEDNLTIRLTESDDSDDSDEISIQYDENEIKRIVKENLKEYKLNREIKKLIKLIENNNNMKNLKEIGEEEINCQYFYNKWKESFSRESYKDKEKYKLYFKIEKITSLKEMGNFICDILKEKRLKIFINDPKGIDKNIKNKLP